jgi:hypothetical protein
MSKKTASYLQLLTYINKERRENDEYFFRHNIYSYKPYYIVKEYRENYKNLRKQKNSNALYHEIISLKRQENLTIEEQREIIKDLAEQYTKARANNNLVYGVIHEQYNQIHCHLMISSNELENHKNKHISKQQFKEIKEKLREYAYIKYPKLEHLVNREAKKKARANAKVIYNEIQYKKRTGKQSDREQIKEIVNEIFSVSKTADDFIQRLKEAKLEIYKKGSVFGFLATLTGKKYRLKTLELENEFQKFSTRLNLYNDFFH